jgi:hypothetical protein
MERGWKEYKEDSPTTDKWNLWWKTQAFPVSHQKPLKAWQVCPIFVIRPIFVFLGMHGKGMERIYRKHPTKRQLEFMVEDIRFFSLTAQTTQSMAGSSSVFSIS